LTTQSAHPVWALVVAIDTSGAAILVSEWRPVCVGKGSYCLWWDTVAVRYVSHGTTFWVIVHNGYIELRFLPLMTTSQFDGKVDSLNDFDGLGSLSR
jgi:hypothetical protein